MAPRIYASYRDLEPYRFPILPPGYPECPEDDSEDEREDREEAEEDEGGEPAQKAELWEPPQTDLVPVVELASCPADDVRLMLDKCRHSICGGVPDSISSELDLAWRSVWLAAQSTTAEHKRTCLSTDTELDRLLSICLSLGDHPMYRRLTQRRKTGLSATALAFGLVTSVGVCYSVLSAAVWPSVGFLGAGPTYLAADVLEWICL